MNGAGAGKGHGAGANQACSPKNWHSSGTNQDGRRWPAICNIWQKGRHHMSTTVFKSLVDTTFDSVEGYRKAGEKAHSPALKSALAERLSKRQQTLATLNAELQRQGDELVTKGTVTGAAHRLWTDITDLFEKGDEAAAERVEEGEDYLAGKFREALEHADLDPQERAVVQQCYAEIAEGERFGDMIEKQYD